MKIDDLYRQQLRIHAWQYMRGILPTNQAAMLSRLSEVHQYNTRSAGMGLHISTQDQKSIGYRIPKEWQSVPEDVKKMSLGGFKKRSKRGFLSEYASFQCEIVGCYVCSQTND